MRFRDLEINQKFKWPTGRVECTKTGNRTYMPDGIHGTALGQIYLTKAKMQNSVDPIGEPPSSERQAREPFHLLERMTPTAEEVKKHREETHKGLQESHRALQKAKVLDGLDALQGHLRADTDLGVVLGDLIEIVKIIAKG